METTNVQFEPETDWLALLFPAGESKPAAVEPAPVKAFVKRHFYRCVDCLTVVASEQKTEYRDKHGYYEYGTCGACSGRMEYMGVTERDRLVKQGFECACDYRCTSAVGPCCNCRCGGANHGSNAVVEVTRDQGGMPQFSVDPGAAVKADVYRGLVEQVKLAINAKYGRLFEAKRNGEWIRDFSVYLEGCGYQRALSNAREGRTHAGRNKKLAAILKNIVQ